MNTILNTQHTLKYLLITNNNNIPINKNFYLNENGSLMKHSNAAVYDATFEEVSVNTLQDLDYNITQLRSNQCISLGSSKHGFINGIITTKGYEDITLQKISRSNDFMSTRNTQGILFDVDPDDQMNDKLLSIKTPDLLSDAFIAIFGNEFMKVSTRIGYGSSFGVKKNDTNELLNVSWSMHAYCMFINVTEKALDNLIEFVKRKCVQEDLWYLKIHKDGSTSFRTLLDLSVIKSLKSRLIFEAPATIGEGLIQEIPTSTFNNCENGIVPFDISTISYKDLPSWKPVYEKEKIKQKDKILAQKEEFRTKMVDELIAKYNYDPSFAKEIINNYLETKLLSTSIQIQSSQNTYHTITQYLIVENVKQFDVYDFLDQQKGLGKSKIYVNNIFNAKLSTYLRGGNTYQVSFNLEEIKYILNSISFERYDIDKILYTLIDYLIDNKFDDNEVQVIIKIVDLKKSTFEFAKHYYIKFIDSKVLEITKDYAFFIFKSKSGYIDLQDDKLEMYKRTDLNEYFSNKYFYCRDPYNLNKTITIDIMKYLVKSKRRTEYSDLAFTDRKVDDKTYNLFKGFAYEAIDHDDVDIEIFFILIREVICNNDEFLFMIVLSFVAQIIQDPFNKLGTSIIIAGAKRIGKGTFIKTILELLGATLSMQTSDKDDVFTRFNDHIMYKLMIYLNEAFWSGDKKIEGSIKSLISDDDTTYEIKNGPSFSGKNYSRLILDSNEKFVIPATFDEGRYIALEASDSRKGDIEFHDKTNEIRKNTKKMEKLMYFFFNFNYKPYEQYLREAPKTKLLGEQIKRNFNLILKWWYSVLINGIIPHVHYIKDGIGIRIATSDLWNSFIRYHNALKTKYENEDSFYTDIKDDFLDDILLKKGLKMPSTNSSAKVLKSLKECRNAFIKKYHIEDFEDDINEWIIPANHSSIPVAY